MKKVFLQILPLLMVLVMTVSCSISDGNNSGTGIGDATMEFNMNDPNKPHMSQTQSDTSVPDTPDGIIKVACVGDSLTFGANATPYPTVLQNLLGSERYEVKNFGAEGRTMTLGLSDATFKDRSYYDSQQYQESLAYQPDIVVLCLGTNDAWRVDVKSKEGKNGYVQGLLKLVDSYYYNAGVQQIYVCLPPDCVKNNIGNLIEEHIISLIKSNANMLDYKVIDCFTPTKDRSDYLQSDQLHLNSQGYAAMAQAVFQAMTGSGESDGGESGGSIYSLTFSESLDGEKIKDIYNFQEKLQ